MSKSKKPLKKLEMLSKLLAIVPLYIVSSILSFLLYLLVAKYIVFNAYPDPLDGRERFAIGIIGLFCAFSLSVYVFGPLMTFVFYHSFGKEKKSSTQR
jgi:hypothetical protein